MIFNELPTAVREAVADHTGQVNDYSSAPNGNHAQIAGTLHTEHGRVFIKGTRLLPDQHWGGPEAWSLRNEAAVIPYARPYARAFMAGRNGRLAYHRVRTHPRPPPQIPPGISRPRTGRLSRYRALRTALSQRRTAYASKTAIAPRTQQPNHSPGLHVALRPEPVQRPDHPSRRRPRRRLGVLLPWRSMARMRIPPALAAARRTHARKRRGMARPVPRLETS